MSDLYLPLYIKRANLFKSFSVYIICMLHKYKQERNMYELTRNEEFILLSIWKLKGHAYGVTIRNDFKNVTGKVLNYGSLYNTLFRLSQRGFVKTSESEPLSRQGGRRKILYALTSHGKKALAKAQKIQKLAWGKVPDLII
jgi:PadR family transcriptional regulator PadR